MGCSSSTQIEPLGSNRPPAKSMETNGHKKSVCSEEGDLIADDIETIPDQTKLETLTENDAPTDEMSPEQDEVEEPDPVESEAAEENDPTPEDEGENAEEAAALQEDEDTALGEVEDKEHEEITSVDAETKEEETGYLGGAEPEISMLIAR
ncbi:hypothetical protein GDO86_010823 [Hymenochirus boettgeri]|uniref:Uncharacterized protein n=1 Tax=Hymenochirus boettgeri TaxID=247094 RepID=A0A8T2J9C8_9PIPI|nr:hypothetical protein GDO86_010823 [Hymenochirus boettgeri]